MTPDAGSMPEVTDHVARFALETRYEAVPERVRSLAKAHILDALGLALAGAAAPGSRIVQAYVASLGCGGGAPVFGTSLATAPRFAALANGAAIHAHDYDDTCPQHRADCCASELVVAAGTGQFEERDSGTGEDRPQSIS